MYLWLVKQDRYIDSPWYTWRCTMKKDLTMGDIIVILVILILGLLFAG